MARRGQNIQRRSVAHATAVGDPIAGILAAVLCPWLPRGDGSTAPRDAISAVFTGDTVFALSLPAASDPDGSIGAPHATRVAHSAARP